MRTAGLCPPLMETSPTPVSCEIFCESMVSARSSTFVSGKLSEVKASVRMGASAGLTLLYTGGLGGGRGRDVVGELVGAWPPRSAKWVVSTRFNRRGVVEAPVELV